jgi:hypothetical protein
VSKPPIARRPSLLIQLSIFEPPHAALMSPIGTATVFCNSRAK